MRGRFSCISAAVSMLIAVLWIAPLVQAQAASQFEVPAQPLADALRAVGSQTNTNLLFDPPLVADRQAPALKGELTTDQAISRLLAGTRIKHEFLNARTIVLARDDTTSSLSTSEEKAPQTDEGAPVSLQGRGAGGEETPSTGEEKKSFWQRFRLAQADTASRSEAASKTPSSRDNEKEVMELEEVVVTGSHIRGGAVSASPVHVYTRADIAAAGPNSVSQLLNTMPQNFSGGNSEQGSAIASGRNGSEGNVSFASGVNLRGLGNESTLVLLNGRRVASGSMGAFVDVSLLPLSVVERVEVMPDGASAIYGSDAVGGVVNFILRKDFSGVETGVYHGHVTDGGMKESSIYQLFGAHWDRGSVLLNVDYRERDPLLATDRPYAAGLQQGVTYLTPADDRLGILVSGNRELTDTLSLSADVYYNDRKAEVRTFSTFLNDQFFSDGDAQQSGGTLALDWQLSGDWNVEFSHTQSRTQSERLNVFAGGMGHVSADVGNSTSEVEAQGALFSAPGGKARLALGVEHREDSYTPYRNDTFAPLLRRDRDINAGYAELLLPLVGADSRASWAHRLDFTVAARYEDYSDVGSKDTLKLGTVWTPVDGMNFRIAYGTSFRAPYLSQYDAPVGTGVLIDLPTTSGSTRVAMLLQAPDPDLGPEEAQTWSAGLDIDPELLGGWRVSATYFHIDYRDRIAVPRADLSPMIFTDPTLRQLISQPPDAAILAQIQTMPFIVNLTDGPFSSAQVTWDGRVRNQAQTKVSGIDFTLDKAFATTAGHFNLGLNASYFLEFENQLVAGGPASDIIDMIFNPVDLRVRGQFGWSRQGWSIFSFVNYTDGYTDNQAPTATVGVDSWTTFDLGVSHSFQNQSGWLNGVTVSAHAINAFDEDPPHITDLAGAWGNPGYDTENANPLGRIVSLNISKRW